MQTLTNPKAFDAHLHLRDNEMLYKVIKYTSQQCARALVMPNLHPKAVETAEEVELYRARIAYQKTDLEALITIKITHDTVPDTVIAAFGAGAIAAKVYPQGATTNSEKGVMDYRKIYPVFSQMEKLGMVLCLHGENPQAFCMDREAAFLETLRDIALSFPKLCIVLEHVTSKAGVDAVRNLPNNVAATITVHHMYLTLDDVIGGFIQPHNHCKPCAKRPEDREAIIKAAISGESKFFLGSDSAPHHIRSKECSDGCAGIFSAPVLLQGLAQKFEENNALDKLANFTSTYGNCFYGLGPILDKIELVKQPWTVPELCDSVIVPFMAGQTLEWSLAETD